MSKQDCLSGNWTGAGYSDATQGYTANSRLNSRTKACAKHAAVPDKPEYLQGYQKGLSQYCSPHNALESGLRNRDYRGICPAGSQSAFLEHYISRLKMAHQDLLFDYWRIGHDLIDARYERAAMTEDQSKQWINQRIDRLSSRRDNLKTARTDIRRKILKWQIQI